MNILYLSDIRFPLERANGIQTMETCYALSERGHNVQLIVRPDTSLPARDPFEFYGLTPNSRLTFEYVPVMGPPIARRAVYLAHVIKRFLDFRQWSMIFTRDLGVAAMVLKLPSRLRAPVVYESHGYAPVFAETLPELVTGKESGSARKLRRLEKRERQVWQCADGYVATTHVLVDELTRRFGPRERLVTLGNAARIESDPRVGSGTPSGPPIAVYAGHFYRWKGVDVFLEALAHVPDLRGLLVGGYPGDPDEARLRALARQLGIGGRVTFTGLVPRAEVCRLVRSATVCVVPTVDTPSARYTSPLKLFEYMACGRPVIISDLPPIREVVEDEQTALLVPPGDVGKLADALRRVLADEVLAVQMTRRASEIVSKYSWVQRAESLDDLFQAVVNSG